MKARTDALVIATGNAHKFAEFVRLLRGVPLLSLSEFPPFPQALEDAPDFAGNAIIKARAAFAATGYPCLADDSGIEVAALGWGPGIRSARYAPGSDADRRRALLDATRESADRRARFICVIAIAGLADDLPLPANLERRDHCVIAHGRVEGAIGTVERGEGGFGYDPVFEIAEGTNNPRRSMAMLADWEKDAISHRARAAHAVLPLVSDLFP